MEELNSLSSSICLTPAFLDLSSLSRKMELCHLFLFYSS